MEKQMLCQHANAQNQNKQQQQTNKQQTFLSVENRFGKESLENTSKIEGITTDS